MSMTSRPWARTPEVNAATSSGPDGRMSRATISREVPGDSSAAKRANAAPMRRQSVASIWSG